MKRNNGIISLIVFTFVISSITVSLISCDDEETIVSYDRCPPSAPTDVYSENRDEYVIICWAPNPESDVAGYDVWALLDPYDEFEEPQYVGTVEDEDPEPYEYCLEDDYPENGERWYYYVTAYDYEDNVSYGSFAVSATPRYEGFIKLYETAVWADSSGYDFSSLSNKAARYDDALTDLYVERRDTVQEFVVYKPDVNIQDYGYASSFDAVNKAPLDGWSPSGRAEIIESHCYVVRLGENAPHHYVKLYVVDSTPSWVTFWWAYQSDPDNTDFAPAPAPFKRFDDCGKRIFSSACLDKCREPDRSTVPPSVKSEGNRYFKLEPVIQNT